MTTPRPDIYARVTARIIEALEQGTRPWIQPWATHPAGAVSRPLRANGKPYQGINVVLLWSEALAKGYSSPFWFTFRQSAELGAHVRKGEQGCQIVYANTFTRTETNTKGEDVERDIPYLKAYTVFNASQIDDLPAHYTDAPVTPLPRTARHDHADAFFHAPGADIRSGGDRAFYAPGPDFIQMPFFETFRDAESHYATLAHEFIHWTRHPKRLARDFGQGRWGDAGYAMEELVAELGSAFLCADLGLTPEVMPDHAAYLASWLQVLRNDKKAIFTAASHAQKAADFLHRLQPEAAAPGQVKEASTPPVCMVSDLTTAQLVAALCECDPEGAQFWREKQRRRSGLVAGLNDMLRDFWDGEDELIGRTVRADPVSTAD